MLAWRTGVAAIALLTFAAADLAEAARNPPPPAHPPALSKDSPKPPWRRRRRSGVKGMIAKDQGVIDLSRWPLEPAVAPPYDVEAFIRALQELCGSVRLPDDRARSYTTWILQYSSLFDVDPFTLAAIVYRQSRCDPKAQGDYGIGLSRIHPRMHGEHIVKRDGERLYKYHVLQGEAWSERLLPLDKFRFTRGGLLMAERNLYFAAALLSVHKQQCPANDGVFGSVPHRHHVSHFYWGDKVRDAGGEDRTLRARRRLIRYYAGDKPTAKAEYRGHPILSPLDGWPRKVTSEMGALRAGGKRLHMGIDFASNQGEPVRAIAAGRVGIAGLDRRGAGAKILSPAQAKAVPRDSMGPGGLFIIINHSPSAGGVQGLQSAYMHLASYRVRTGQKVEAGEIIGWVGRTGISHSGAHLHFELRQDEKHIDPLPVLQPYLFDLESTWRGRRVAYEDKRQRRKQRRAQRRAARAAAKAKRALEAQQAGTR